MKKNILKATLVAAIALVASVNVYNAQQSGVEMSDLALVNVEALAHEENGFGCDNGCVDGGGGCECHGWYEYYKEYQWPK